MNHQSAPENKLQVINGIQIVVILIAFTVLFGRTIEKLCQSWLTNENYSHGFLIPLIAGYMIWQKRDQLRNIRINPSNLGIWVIICGMCIFVAGNIGAELFISRTAIIITIAGLCICSFGIRITTVIAVPLIYLMFMVPLPAIIWNKIAFPLQLLAAKWTSNVVHFIGIPLLREGNILRLSNTTLEVVDACSGLRSLTSLLALSAAYAYIAKLSKTSKWILFFSAVPIAIAVNILRLTSTAIMATAIGPDAAQGFLHEISGILVFILAFIMLYVLYLIISKIEKKYFAGGRSNDN